jgi:hypothetical protein
MQKASVELDLLKQVLSARAFSASFKGFLAFHDADLRRAFDGAKPVRCSDLVSDTG